LKKKELTEVYPYLDIKLPYSLIKYMIEIIVTSQKMKTNSLAEEVVEVIRGLLEACDYQGA
jgi:hypothetical protein